MLVTATIIFLYYTTWTLFMVSSFSRSSSPRFLINDQPFVDPGHPLHDFFPPRVWAIRIPVILLLLGSAVVGSFLSIVMIKSNRKKAAKARVAAAGKKTT